MRQLTLFVLLGSSIVACARNGANVDSAESALDSSDTTLVCQ